MNTNQVKRLCSMQRSYTRIHNKTGLCGITTDGVHVNAEEMQSIMGMSGVWSIRDRELAEWPVEFGVEIDGVEFYALCDFQDVQNLGLTRFLKTTGTLQARYDEWAASLQNSVEDPARS